MIALSSNCLLFQLSNGESVPCSEEMICIEIVGSPDSTIDPEMLRHAAASVFHYFKNDLERETVTVGEFAGASDGLGYTIQFASTQLDTAQVFAALLLVSILGIVFYYAAEVLERVVVPWAPRFNQD